MGIEPFEAGSRPEPIPEESARLMADFLRFKATFPVHRWKAEPLALAAWFDLRPDSNLVTVILAALQRQKQSDEWTREGGRYIPSPEKYIVEKRWKDGTAAPPTADAIPPLSATGPHRYSSRPDGKMHAADTLRLAADMKRERLKKEKREAAEKGNPT